MGAERLNTLVGNYRLTDSLGAGGMGEVYRGLHVRTGQSVAVKILSAKGIEARDLARFYHEARVQSALAHPNIVRLHELVTVEGRPCLVMEYVDGGSLADRIVRSGRLAPEEALQFLRDIASAIAHVHAQGVIHRDIKPGNVRVTSQGDVKLLDFGIASSRHVRDLTLTGHVIGTPIYLSPEQLLGEPATPASDIWAMGVLLYEMTTGKPPFKGATTDELLARIDSGKFIDVNRVLHDDSSRLIRGIDAIVKDCLARDPRRRLASADALSKRAAALLSVASPARPVPAQTPRPESLRPLLSSAIVLARRRWRWIAAAAVLVIAIVIVLGWSASAPNGGGDAAVQKFEVTSGRADVFVNGRSIGSTPATYNGRVGETVDVELRQEGYETIHENVMLSPNQTSTFAMQPKRTP